MTTSEIKSRKSMKEIKLFQTCPQRTLAPDGFTNDLYQAFMDDNQSQTETGLVKNRRLLKEVTNS